MTKHQILARRYRPQLFADVCGQDAIVSTLKNAIAHDRLAHAYLFCGPRGTGKTTFARLFAKALNCANRQADGEPCNSCPSCKEITQGNSLDVLEIDGASHRGIDDVRQINETVGYAAASGGHKIYIIDEVHMLTKEAFNALLKTLEEPPAKVLFFFATTEPHKVLPTIVSRCQRFNLNRIPTALIVQKLSNICSELKVSIDSEALHMIAERAEGGLRDAESLLDQMIAFHDTAISAEDVGAVLGVIPRDILFTLDSAGKKGELSIAFELADKLFKEGKDLIYFVETLTDHYRQILLTLLNATDLKTQDPRYLESAKLYNKEQCLTLLDYLVEQQQKIRFAPSARIAIEMILLTIIRSHSRIPVEFLVRKLTELEHKGSTTNTSMAEPAVVKPAPKPKSPTKTAPPPEEKLPAPIELGARPTTEAVRLSKEEKNHYDTLIQFAAVELEGIPK